MAEGSGPARGVAHVPPLLDLATRIYEWCDAQPHAPSLRTLALHASARHDAIATTVVGARTEAEVETLLQSAAEEVPDAAWADFEAEFGAEIDGFQSHWYYSG